MKIAVLTAAFSAQSLVMLLGLMLAAACLRAEGPRPPAGDSAALLRPRAAGRYVPRRGAAATKPAARWEEAFLSGNGRMGVMMYGKPYDETVVLNHCRLYLPRGTREILPDLARFAGEFKAAGLKGGPAAVHRLMCQRAKENGQQGLIHTDPFHPAFMLGLKMPAQAGPVRDYLMTENFETGELAVRWADGAGRWERKLFASRADNVVVLSISGPGGQVGCELGVTISHALVKPEIVAEKGRLTAHAVYVKGKGGYDSVITVAADGGTVAAGKGLITVTGADRVLVMMRVEPWAAPLPPAQSEAWACSPKNPAFAKGYKTNLTAEIAESLAELPADYDALLARHARIHGELFSRVSLDLGGGADRDVLTETLLDRAAKDDRMPPALMETMYDACRYLTICSTGERIPNLQGIWTGTWNPAWSGDYTLDSNTQLEINSIMSANLPELMAPYFSLVESWLPDCRLNARKIYGCRGIVTNARASNTCLLLHWVGWVGEQFISGAGWLAHYFYDYTLFTGDREFLRKRTVPLLKEIVLFYEDLLAGTEGADGRYRFFISYSPEQHLVPNATIDIAVARETLGNLIFACEELGIEQANVPKWKTMLRKMPPYVIGKNGALQEWAVENGEALERHNHRHYSQFYPLFQSYEFDPERTPKLWKASQVALEMRARHWLRAKRPNSSNITHGMMNHAQCAARLGQGEVVHEILSRMVTRRYVFPSFMIGYWPNRRGFGFDAVGTIPDVVNNALVFSHRGTLELLPALPSAWPKGAVSGILARGQITIDRLQWNRPAGTLRLELTSGRDQTVRLRLATGQAIKSIRVTGADVKDPPGEGGARRVVLSRGRRAVVEMTY